MPSGGKFTILDSGKLGIRASGKADVCDDCCGTQIFGLLFGTDDLYKINLEDGSRSQYASPTGAALFGFDVDAQGNTYADPIITKRDSSGTQIWTTATTATFINIRDIAVDENGRVCIVGTSNTSNDCIEFYDEDGTYIAGYQLSTVIGDNIAFCVRPRGDGHFLVGAITSNTWDDTPGSTDADKRNVWEFLASDGSNTDSFITSDPASATPGRVEDIAITDDGGFGCAVNLATNLAVKFDSSGSIDYQIANVFGARFGFGVAASGNDLIYSIDSGPSASERDKVRSYDSSGSLNWSVTLPTGWKEDQPAIGINGSLFLISSTVSNLTARVYNDSGSFQRELDDTLLNYKWIKAIGVGSTP